MKRGKEDVHKLNKTSINDLYKIKTGVMREVYHPTNHSPKEG